MTGGVTKAYAWPGNVRELRNTIERIRLFHGDKTEYGLDDLLDVLPDWNDGVPPARAVGRQDKPPDQSPATANGARSHARPNSESERSPLRLEEAVLHLFLKYGKLTRKELIAELQIAPNTATNYLNRLIDAGYIEKVTPSRSTRSDYFQLVDASKNTSKKSDLGLAAE